MVAWGAAFILGEAVVATERAIPSAKHHQRRITAMDRALKEGKFSAASLDAAAPLSYQTAPEWEALLMASEANHGGTWLHALHLGTIAAERGDVVGSIAHFSTSVRRQDNAIAYRNLAVATVATAPTNYYNALQIAVKHMLQGKEGGEAVVISIASEGAATLRSLKDHDVLRKFLSPLPADERLGMLDEVLLARVSLAVAEQNVTEGLALLSAGCFASLAAGPLRGIPGDGDEAIAWWHQLHEAQAARIAGHPLSPAEAHAVRIANPPPSKFGCATSSGTCPYW